MKFKFWGVKADISTPGPEHERYGGSTACVEVRDSAGEVVILDGGNGLYWLGRSLLATELGKGKGRAALVLSHTHWDRTCGFPFFVPVFIPGNEIRVLGGMSSEAKLEGRLEGQMQPHYSPMVSLTNLGATLKFEVLEDGASTTIGGITLTLGRFPNRVRGMSFGYRLEENGTSLAYMIDMDYDAEGTREAAAAFLKGCDVVIHEAFGVGSERGAEAMQRSTWREATEIALQAEVGALYYFYHHPDQTDDGLDAALEAQRSLVESRGVSSPPRLEIASEGLEVEL